MSNVYPLLFKIVVLILEDTTHMINVKNVTTTFCNYK